MDHSIAAATWFAARGKGTFRSVNGVCWLGSLMVSILLCFAGVLRLSASVLASSSSTDALVSEDGACDSPLTAPEAEKHREYTSPARVLLIGSGADEQFGGTIFHALLLLVEPHSNVPQVMEGTGQRTGRVGGRHYRKSLRKIQTDYGNEI